MANMSISKYITGNESPKGTETAIILIIRSTDIESMHKRLNLLLWADITVLLGVVVAQNINWTNVDAALTFPSAILSRPQFLFPILEVVLVILSLILATYAVSVALRQNGVSSSETARQH